MAFGDRLRVEDFPFAATTALTLSSAVPVGNTIIVSVASASATVSDDVNGTYTKIGSQDTSGNASVSLHMVISTDGATAPTITVSGGYIRANAAEFEGSFELAGAPLEEAILVSGGSSVTDTTSPITIPANSVSIAAAHLYAGSIDSISAPWTSSLGFVVLASRTDASSTTDSFSFTYSGRTASPDNYTALVLASFTEAGGAIPTIRKSSTFDIETTLGTITTATLNSVNVFDHVSGQVGTTVSFAGAATDEITTSGEYDLVLGDGTGTETITVQVNVYGVAPSNNPLQKDGSALASLTGVQLRVTDGANLNGTELYYSGTGTTDASGNLGNIDLSSTSAADTDPVLLHMRTSAGDSIIADETVELI